jgi:Ni/Co efflux regulator RcnB
MRNWMIATAGLALTAAGAVDAQQRVVTPGPGAIRPGATFPAPQQGMAPAPVIEQRAPRQGQWQAQSWQRGGYPGQRPTMPQVRPGQPHVPRGGNWNGNGNGNARANGNVRPPMVHAGQSRWGSKIGGRWWGGANAPGGWSAYRRPFRGYALPTYWIAPRFYITDWQAYGLTQPAGGYNWVRYYDDAVLVDGRGSVYDTRSGIDWDRSGDGDYAGDDRVYADGGYDDRAYDDRAYDDRGYDDRVYDARRDTGVGGAVAGAAIGGVAGNLVAGRGNRLGGTLIGAGVGAAAGYAIDKAEDRRGPPPPPVYDRGYAVPVAPDRAPPPPPVGYAQSGGNWRSSDGTTTVTTTNGPSGYYRGGYYYPAASTTTIVVQTAPVVTTTTTEIYEDAVTYTRKPAVRTKTRRVWRPAPKCRCN